MDKKKIRLLLLSASCVLLIVCVVLFSFIIKWNSDKPDSKDALGAGSSVNTAVPSDSDGTPGAAATPEPVTYTEMTLLSTGDFMMHMPQVNSALQADGTYDFTEYTKYINDIISEADYAVLNLETTILGEGYEYTSYPSFNSPESLLDAVSYAGFDMCLFANNHTYDKGHLGLINTQNFISSHGLDYIGTRLDTESKSYKIIEANGIKLGLLNYTYETNDEGENVKFLNGIRLDTRSNALVDSFNINRLEKFYTEVEQRMDEMKKDGADMIVMYIHWGDEYDKRSNSTQQEIAQRLCNLGVDAIVGSHPHVVQESALLTSDDGKHVMACLYSTGNFISNQNRLTLTSSDPEGYTENSVLYKITFRKYSTGETIIVNTDYVATWVHRRQADGRISYTIVPLEKALADDSSKAKYGLYDSSFGVSHAATALERIDALLKDGVEAFNAAVVLPYNDSEVTAAVVG